MTVEEFPHADAAVGRLIIHQFDPARPSPGGIDTCLRGLCRYAPGRVELAVVGVDAGADVDGRRLGRWERHRFGDNTVRFLPVARLDPANQRRRVPHSVRLIAGLVRYHARLPRAAFVQAHRMDVALAAMTLLRRPAIYYIHTQERGLTGATSDSWWRWAGAVHERLERHVVRRAREVRVFNRTYAAKVAVSNARTRFSPTWFDPATLDAVPPATARRPREILWVGRLEAPKDPGLAVDAFRALVESHPDAGWSLRVVGSGTLGDDLRSRVRALPAAVADAVSFDERLPPRAVAAAIARAAVFLMTSQPGYEGYPRVLVEAMAGGLPAVVTTGADTGGLVVEGETGFVVGPDRSPHELARRIIDAETVDRDRVRTHVASLDATVVVPTLFEPADAH